MVAVHLQVLADGAFDASHASDAVSGLYMARFVLAEQGSELGAEVVKGVLVLGEDDQLAKASPQVSCVDCARISERSRACVPL